MGGLFVYGKDGSGEWMEEKKFRPNEENSVKIDEQFMVAFVGRKHRSEKVCNFSSNFVITTNQNSFDYSKNLYVPVGRVETGLDILLHMAYYKAFVNPENNNQTQIQIVDCGVVRGSKRDDGDEVETF